ncbi:MAG: helix-turn-helix domain-containing protein [Actinomycetota bacterium]|nr:helix-turn-helix domain-containing protein [Actinomycetota bacterium]
MGQEREAFAAELRLLRASSGLSLGQLAQAAHVNRGYVGHVEHGQRWPSRSVAAALDAAVGADGALLGVWTAGDAAVRRAQVGSVVAASRTQQPEDSEVVLMSAADESAHFLAWAEASNTGDLTVEEMHSDIRRIAHSYLKVPTLPLFARARAIRDHAFTLLAGRQSPCHTRDLYAAAGWALTLLAWMSTDLGRPDAAGTHARAAWLCAEHADHNGLRAWVRATQHTAARWEHRFLDAACYAEEGLTYATTGSAELLLASAQALDLANAGQADNARVALARAHEVAETVEQADDELAGPFTCSVHRAAGGFWSDVHLALGEPTDALAEADRAVAACEQAPIERRNHGSERMARVQQVRAHLALDEFDGAGEALAPVLETGPEHRVRPLLQRLAEVHTQSLTCEQPGEPILCTMREAITDFRRQAVVAELIT